MQSAPYGSVGRHLFLCEQSIRDALEELDRTAMGHLILVDANDRLLRMVTDGDLRRLLLKDGSTETLLEFLPDTTTITADMDTPVEALRSSPHLGNLEQQFVKQAFDTNWITPIGPQVEAFEEELAQYAEVGHVAALS